MGISSSRVRFLLQRYRLGLDPHRSKNPWDMTSKSCGANHRNCKSNPHCIRFIGEKDWITGRYGLLQLAFLPVLLGHAHGSSLHMSCCVPPRPTLEYNHPWASLRPTRYVLPRPTADLRAMSYLGPHSGLRYVLSRSIALNPYRYVSDLKARCTEAELKLSEYQGPYVGIENLGATCYVNSFLQLWFHNPPFRKCIFDWTPSPSEYYPQLCLRKSIHRLLLLLLPVVLFIRVAKLDFTYSMHQGTPFSDATMMEEIQRVFTELQHLRRRSIKPIKFIDSLNISHIEQQDAQEFGKLCMQKFEQVLLTGNSAVSVNGEAGPAEVNLCQTGYATTFIKREYSGKLAYKTTCTTCNTSSSQVSPSRVMMYTAYFTFASPRLQ